MTRCSTPGSARAACTNGHDAPNRLHFYVIDIRRDEKGILSYTVGVKSLDGAGPQARGVTASAPAALAVAGLSSFNVTVRNTGAAAPATTPSPHPQDAAPYLLSDIYRLSIAVDSEEWSAALESQLVAVKFGESIAVPVHVMRRASATAPTKVTVMAVSESDQRKTATVSTIVSARNDGQ